ncbi:MAG: hypothetical protein GOVbin3205_66 [Prokaryotic dsDNA virus sp.]|mgnify:CR=1 FL=1|jgi:hypothetical protein|nr:MAG: hypothetical protein GOVbin3205_66 [Prokaryotic dsDNA virus sp.]|tara:strand:+ start:1980 stop:2582 length:603 start_codon:yes stop_codon:yes gene_type:complete
MATPGNEQFIGFNPSVDLTERNSKLINSKRQIYTYEEMMSGAIGATTLDVGSQAQLAGISKLGATYNLGGIEYDSYNLKCVTSLTPEATAHVVAIGSIEVGAGNIFFISNRSNIESVDFLGSGGYTNNPLNFGAMVDDATEIARPLAGVFYINQENIPTFPIEFNAMYIVAADAANFECDVYVDMDFIVEKGTTVEFTIA